MTPASLRGSGLGLGALWLSRGERAALEALGDAAPGLLRRGAVWGRTAISLQAAVLALGLIPWGVAWVAWGIWGRLDDALAALVVVGLLVMTTGHPALMAAVDCVHAGRVLPRGLLRELQASPVPAWALSWCLVLPQGLALRGGLVAALAVDVALATAVALADPEERVSPATRAACVGFVGVMGLARLGVLAGLRRATAESFRRGWPRRGIGLVRTAVEAAHAHAWFVAPAVAWGFLLVTRSDTPDGMAIFMLWGFGLAIMLAAMADERLRAEPEPGPEEWWMLRGEEG